MTQISSRAEYPESARRFARSRQDWREVELEPSEPIRGYAREIARLLGIVVAGCCLLVALLAVHP